MTGSPSPYQPEPEGADRNFYDRQALIAEAAKAQIDSRHN